MITKISKNIQKNILRSAVRRAAMSTEATLSSAETEEKLHDVPLHMSNSEAFVETMVAHGVTVCTGIVGSAFLDTLDLVDKAGIRFVSVAHEQNAAHMADGYARASGKHGVCIAQNDLVCPTSLRVSLRRIGLTVRS